MNSTIVQQEKYFYPNAPDSIYRESLRRSAGDHEVAPSLSHKTNEL